MTILKIVYSVQYNHILTFSSEYRKVIAPYFKYPNLSYGFEDLDSFNESIRLIFSKEHYAVHCRKDAVIFVYEGPIENVMNSSSPPMDFLFDIVNSISQIPGFGNFTHHQLQLFGVVEAENICEVSNAVEKSSFIKKVPFDVLDNFAVVFESKDDNKASKFEIGNFKAQDVDRFKLSEFKSDFNEGLRTKSGYLYNLTIKEKSDKASFSRYKAFLDSTKKKLYEFP